MSDFLDVVYTTSKNELKMMWLTLKYWILFPLKNKKLTPDLFDEVTCCLGSITFSFLSAKIMNAVPPYEAKGLWIEQDLTYP